MTRVRLAERAEDAEEAIGELRRSGLPLALDLESNGMFAYEARPCTAQVSDGERVLVVDLLAVPTSVLAPLAGDESAWKLVHDVGFDARLLAREGAPLVRVFDTAVAAQLLGVAATGLGSLAASELGVTLDKRLQKHDWSRRPLEDVHLDYLAADVAHLPALAARLRARVEETGIAAEVDEETRFRLAQAIRDVDEEGRTPPWARVRGALGLREDEAAVLRALVEVREARARADDRPAGRVVSSDALVALARAKPTSRREVERLLTGPRLPGLVGALVEAARRGVEAARLPEDEAHLLAAARARPSPEQVRRTKAREARLGAWRKARAEERGLCDQAVLPGHVLRALANLDPPTPEAVARVPGFGAFRAARDGEALLAVLTDAATPDAAADAPRAPEGGT